MIITKCPYRISLLGGSSDIDWYLKSQKRGASIGFSLNQHSKVVIQKKELGERGILNYSSREEYLDISTISHPLIREAMKKIGITYPIEIASFGSSINGGGLGGSSSFLVALCKGLMLLKNKKISNLDVADMACDIEINILKKPIGRQDQYLCATGGVNILKFKDKEVKIFEDKKIEDCVSNYAEKLFLINTSRTRSTSKVLNSLKSEENIEKINNLRKIAEEFIEESKNCTNENMETLLEKKILNSWKIKQSFPNVLDNQLKDFEKMLTSFNLKVLKLCGAGNGGYFLVRPMGETHIFKSILNKKNISYSKVEVDRQGCCIWNI